MAINCGVDAIAPTPPPNCSSMFWVLWAENRHSIGTSVPYEGSIRLIPNLLGCQSWAHAESCGPPFWFISWGSSSSVGLTWLSPSRGLCLQEGSRPVRDGSAKLLPSNKREQSKERNTHKFEVTSRCNPFERFKLDRLDC